jgi:drug/metabolite transporter (DMT)-like permease
LVGVGRGADLALFFFVLLVLFVSVNEDDGSCQGFHATPGAISGMRFAQLTLMLFFVAMMSGGQILFKLAAGTLKATHATVLQAAVAITLNPYLIAGVLLYGAATVLWVFILQSTPIARAYPVVALTVVVVPAIGILAFGEAFSPSLLVGGALIVSGILVITLL